MDSIAERMNILIEKIRYYNQKYYQEQISEIADHEYDHLLAELRALEEEHPEYLRSDSPTRRVGDSLTPDGKHILHREKMLSIDNVYSESELISWYDRIIRKKIPTDVPVEWVCELKIDGVAASLIYKRGEFKQALTRGNGIYGDDITEAVRLIKDVPKKFESSLDYLEVRGEVYMENSELVRINMIRAEHDEKTFANTRNITAGTLKNTDIEQIKDRRLRFFAHSTGSLQAVTATNHFDFMHELEELGFKTSPHIKKVSRFTDAIEYCREIIPNLHELDFEIDGIVIKVNDFAQREIIGGTPKFPHWLIAYKFEKYEAATKIREIRFQIGKTGTVTPVAELEPVNIAGTIVSRASLHNAEEIARKDVRVGDTVIVEKAGKIIPHVVRVEKHLRKGELPSFTFPENCPTCGEPLKKDEGGVFIRCPNPNCLARVQELLEYFASRNAMDIDGLGPALVEQLTTPRTDLLFESKPLVSSFADLYRLKEADIISLERKSDKSAKKLIQAIQESKKRGPARLLNALSIKGIGEETSRLLMNQYLSFDKLALAKEEDLAAIPTIGEILAASVYDYFHSECGKATIAELTELGLVMEQEPPVIPAPGEEGIFAGLSICITGKLAHFENRDMLKNLIIKNGGKFVNSVTSKTSFLLSGTGEENGKKTLTAQKLGIEIIDEVEFLERYPQFL